MRTSVLISTYNATAWLEKVLWGYFNQTILDFEIIIADDGSKPETAALIARISAESPVPIVHVWQQDDGFQKCRILNKSIAVSTGETLFITDGDCVPRPDTIEAHRRLARPSHFLSGAYFKLPENVSKRIDRTSVETGQAFTMSWLVRNGMRPNSKYLKLLIKPPFDTLFNFLSPARRTWNGHNASCLKADAVRINGFNEDMQYGGLDVEFGLRLQHSGIKHRHIRYSTLMLHLHHGHGYVTPEMRLNSRRVKENTRSQKLIWAERGLDQWRSADGSAKLGEQDRVTRYPAVGRN